MKPSWDDSPPWATFLAKDDSGDWWWYQVRPEWKESEGKWWPQPNTEKIKCEFWTRMKAGNGTLEPRP